MPSPYLRAFRAYHDGGQPAIPWHEVLDAHLQAGHVTATARLFLLAREVAPAATAAQLEDLAHLVPGSGHWHVFLAAGAIPDAIAIARQHGAHIVTWHRFRGGGTRRFRVADLPG